MGYVSKIEYDGAFYDIQDAVAQEKADTATSAAASAVATAEAAETAATEANETAEEAKAIAQGVAGSYSLDELDTGATWLDGRHVYKKTVSCNLSFMQGGATYNLASGVVIENLSYLINAELFQVYASATPTIINPQFIWLDGAVLKAAVATNTNAAISRYCTIYYVKTA